MRQKKYTGLKGSSLVKATCEQMEDPRNLASVPKFDIQIYSHIGADSFHTPRRIEIEHCRTIKSKAIQSMQLGDYTTFFVTLERMIWIFVCFSFAGRL